MTTPPSATPRPTLAEPDLAAEANFLAEHIGWPISIDVPHHRLILHTGDVLDALRIPRTLAEPLALELSTNLMAGPVSRDNDDRWWTFITEPCTRPNIELPHACARHAYTPSHPADNSSSHRSPHPHRGGSTPTPADSCRRGPQSWLSPVGSSTAARDPDRPVRSAALMAIPETDRPGLSRDPDHDRAAVAPESPVSARSPSHRLLHRDALPE